MNAKICYRIFIQKSADEPKQCFVNKGFHFQRREASLRAAWNSAQYLIDNYVLRMSGTGHHAYLSPGIKQTLTAASIEDHQLYKVGEAGNHNIYIQKALS